MTAAATPPAPAPAPAPPASGPAVTRRTVACTGAAGCLTLLLGAGLAVLGLGFANATACGTGVAAAGVGLWTLLALRGLRQQRRRTLVGLALAWAVLLTWTAVDRQATVGSLAIVLFLVPVVTVPLGLAWLTATGLGTVGLTRAAWRTTRRHAWPRPEPGPSPRRAWTRLAVRLAILAACASLAPPVARSLRGAQIARLAAAYPTGGQPPAADRPVTFGACSMVFLGYELTQHDTGSARTAGQRQAAYDQARRDAEAELASIRAAGGRYVRVGASGDQLLAANPDQEAVDDAYMAAVARSGLGLVLVDTQHPRVLRDRKLDWPEFCRFQRDRVLYYQTRYSPDVYFVVCEPLSYHHFGLTRQTAFSAEAWAAQLSDLCRLVKSQRPATRTGICLLVMPEKRPEWDVWTRMRSLPELDILSVEIYSPENFGQAEERLRSYGHPRETGKAFWIAETFNGWAMSHNRPADQDAAWLRVADGFARRVDAEAVLVWTFGTFVPGGSLGDFWSGRLQQLWGAGDRLSEVGQAFAELSGPPTPSRPR